MSKEEYLQKISQCLFDMQEIISACYIKPFITSKKLNTFYLNRRNNLSELLGKKVIPLNISAPNNSLPDNILFRKIETVSYISEIEEADNYLSKSLGKVQMEREKNPNYKATTGIKDIELKKEINDFLAKKKLENNSEKFGKNISKNKKHTISLDFPEKFEWDKIEIKIKDGLKDAEIFYNGTHKKTASYQELGFGSSKKEAKENRQWELLKILSVLFATNITQATPNHLADMLTKQTDKKITTANIHQIKKSLAKSLQGMCGTEENPFLNYKDRGYYEIKFKLSPPTILKNEELWSTRGKRYNENIGTEEEYNTENGF